MTAKKTLLEVDYIEKGAWVYSWCFGKFYILEEAIKQIRDLPLDHEDLFDKGVGTYLFSITYDEGDFDYNCDGEKVCIAPPYYEFDLLSFKKTEGY